MKVPAASAFALTPEVSLVDLTQASPAAMADYHLRNREHLRLSMPRRTAAFFGTTQWQAQIAAYQASGPGVSDLRLVLVNGEQVVGTVGFGHIVRGGFHACYLGYGLDAAWQGRGLMRRAVAAGRAIVIEQLGVTRIMANHLPENIRSSRLLTSLGFVREGYARDYLEIDGVWRDHVLTAYTRRPDSVGDPA